MLIAVLLGLILSLFADYLYKKFGDAAGKLISMLPVGLFLFYLSYLPSISDGYIVKESYSWVPSLGIDLSFYLDGLSLTFALIITGIGSAVFFYASEYMKTYKYKNRFYIYILIFMSAMLGVTTSDNIISIFVFWELTSVSSFLLIGFNHDKEDSRYSAWQALLVTGLGGLALLAGLILSSIATGSMSINEIISAPSQLSDQSYFTAIIILIAIGAFTKSAQFPFHFWLPNAMAAPTPVSAYLHSATMVKAGIYILARLNPGFADSELWQYLLITAGALTMLGGSIIAFRQDDLKKLLAYTTVSVLGTLTMLIGVGTEKAIKAMIIYLSAHSLYKGALFLVAGIIDHETGTRNVRNVSGLKKLMPYTFFAGAVAAISMLGFIPMLGFVGKEVLYESLYKFNDYGYYLLSAAILASIMMGAVGGLSGLRAFIGKEKFPNAKPHEAPRSLYLGPVILGVGSILFGLLPGFTINGLFMNAAYNVVGKEFEGYISLWHGFNIIFGLSLVTVAIAVISYIYRDMIVDLYSKFRMPKLLSPAAWYDYAFNGIFAVARGTTKFLQNGYLRNYITISVITTIVLVFTAMNKFYVPQFPEIDLEITFYEIIISMLIVISTIMVIRSKSRLASIIGLGVIGFSIAIFYMIYSAPDLAMTQFAVETLTVILFMLVIYKLPKLVDYSKMPVRMKDFALAISVGFMMSLIILFVTSENLPGNIKEYFAAESYVKAKGKNIVNVILVDFRAIDTLGEIVVLAVAAMGVFSLIRDNDKIKGGSK